MASNQIVGPAAQFTMRDSNGITSLNDNSGGTASNTIASLAGLGNAATSNAIASLAAKIEEILVVLENAGIMPTAYTD
jgi:hypothetical protein